MTVLTRTRLRGAVVTMLAVVELATTGCASGGAGRGDDPTGEDTRDAAGKTQAQVANLSLKDEFDSAGERYEHGQAVLAAAQRQIRTAPGTGTVETSARCLPATPRSARHRTARSRRTPTPSEASASSDPTARPARSRTSNRGSATSMQKDGGRAARRSGRTTRSGPG